MESILASAAAKAIFETVFSNATTIFGQHNRNAADAVGKEVVNTIHQREDVAVVPVKSMAKSFEGWAAVFGALVTLGNYFNVGVPQPVAQALDTIGTAIGFPEHFGSAVATLVVVGSFCVIWVRRNWFTRAITPTSANNKDVL